MGEFHELDAREYKLLLRPAWFEGAAAETPSALAARLWAIADTRLFRMGFRPTWPSPAFEAPRERTVRYWDTPDRGLNERGYTLRERTGGGKREVTLKLRTPDLFVSATTALPGAVERADTKFEEDIAPLEVERTVDGVKQVVLAERRSIRSRFSLSTTQPLAQDRRLDRMADAYGLYPSLEENLAAEAASIPANSVLVPGRVIHEVVRGGLTVDLGREAAFTLTFWRFESAARSLDVAEISFKCKLKDHRIGGGPARRALALFIAMQNALECRVNVDEASKTALALRIA